MNKRAATQSPARPPAHPPAHPAFDNPPPQGLSGWFHRLTGGGPRPADEPRHPAAIPVPGAMPKARFLTASFTNQAGTRPYKLFVPGLYRHGTPVPLIVMLHGCTQSPDDFAAGTRMNELAETHTCLVVWPEQIGQANPAKCWNWFQAEDQRRDSGEPSLIAGITREVMRDYTVDPRRVYVAGLSAGGAAAAIMGDAYPELYAAIGVHSGLACGAAHNLASALRAMKRGGDGRRAARMPARVVPTIVFHGDQDTTVNPRNAEAVVAQTAQASPDASPLTVEMRKEQFRAATAIAARCISIPPAGR